MLLQPLASDQPACRLDLGARQPRSLLVCQLGGSSRGTPGTPTGGGGGSPESSFGDISLSFTPHAYLVVGTSSGEVLWWRLGVQQDAWGGAAALQLHPCGWARAGLAPVALHLLPPDPVAEAAAAAYSGGGIRGEPCVLALAEDSIILEPDPVHPARLAVLRLHGGAGLSAACPLLAAELPGSRVAAMRGGQLVIASLEPEARLRWDEVPLHGGAAASAAAYHSPSGCAAVACAEADGSSSLRFVDACTLHELARMAQPPGHTITAVAALALPCSSAATGSDGDATGMAVPGAALQLPACKHFLVVAVAEEGSAIVLPAEGLPPVAVAARSDQPWWRQVQQEEQQLEQKQQERQQGEQPQPQQQAPRLRGWLQVYAVQTGGGSSGGGNGSHARPVLLGSCPLHAAAFSLATVQADVLPFDRAAGLAAASNPRSPLSASATALAVAAEARAQQPLLAAGCDDGAVRLYR